MSDRETWRLAVAQLARNQHGYVRLDQLVALGIPATTVAAWRRDGKLILVHRGVYAVAYRRSEPRAVAAAAVLAGHPDAVLSHDSAAALWGLRRWPEVPEITSPGCIRRPRIKCHRSRTMSPGDITTHWGIHVTTPFRTIQDISPRLTTTQRKRITANARLEHLISADHAADLRGHRRNPTRSGGEDRLEQRLLDDRDVPAFETNAVVAGKEADFWFTDRKVVVELDHPETHPDPEDDKRRDLQRALAGILTIRIPTADFDADPDAVVAHIIRVLVTRPKAS